MASSRPGRCSPSSLQDVSGDETIYCFARERVDRDKGGRPPDDADLSSALSLFWKALRHNPSALTQPPISGCSPSLHLGSCPAHRERRATWAGRPGRLVRASRSRSRTARRERMPQNTGPAAPARRRPRAAACRAIGRSPTKSDLVGCSFKCSPNATALEVRSTLKSA